jgi:hypothetical protein
MANVIVRQEPLHRVSRARGAGDATGAFAPSKRRRPRDVRPAGGSEAAGQLVWPRPGGLPAGPSRGKTFSRKDA